MSEISLHITKKVADRLNDIFKNEPPMSLRKNGMILNFSLEYGMITDEKFYEKASKVCSVKND